MPLSLADCQRQIQDTLGRPAGSIASAQMMIDTAGEYLVACYPWKWLIRPPTGLDLRAQISFTGASWVNGTLTLTDTELTPYVFRTGDQVVITAGTNTTLGTYNVGSKPTTTSITLTSSIGASASNVSGTLSFPWLVLPSDFQQIIQLKSSASTLCIEQTTYQRILELREVSASTSGFGYYCALLWRGAFTESPLLEKAPVPRLELWPTPTTNTSAAFSLIYRAGWPVQADDANFALMPQFVQPLYVQILRAVARGFEEEEEGSMSRRLPEIMAGPLFMAAKRRDDMVQSDYGPITGGELAAGSADSFQEEGFDYLGSPVNPPSTA